MKKKSIVLSVVVLMLTACSNGNNSVVLNNKAMPEQQMSSEPKAQTQETENGFWEQTAATSTKDSYILNFTTGIQIILPKEWEGEIMTEEDPEFALGSDTLTVSDKRNADEGGGGTLFYLVYDDRKGLSKKYPLAIEEGFDTLLGTYEANGEEYALIQELPTELNYVEGNKELEKHYNNLYALVNKVQIITDKMPGFTKCGIGDIDWVIYNPGD